MIAEVGIHSNIVGYRRHNSKSRKFVSKYWWEDRFRVEPCSDKPLKKYFFFGHQFIDRLMKPKFCLSSANLFIYSTYYCVFIVVINDLSGQVRNVHVRIRFQWFYKCVCVKFHTVEVAFSFDFLQMFYKHSFLQYLDKFVRQQIPRNPEADFLLFQVVLYFNVSFV